MAGAKTFSKTDIRVEGHTIQLHRKNVKNLNLRVYPGEGEIKMSVPRRLPKREAIRFIKEKLPWIKKQLNRKPVISRKLPLEYQTGEKHMVWGKPYLLRVDEVNGSPSVYASAENAVLQMKVRPGSSKVKKATVLKEWYRNELKREIPKLIEKWEPVMKVTVQEFGVKQMKTRWGSCNIRDRRIWLNLELAKKRPQLLEYVVVHEMTHLLERLHSKRFYRLMQHFLPNWKQLEQELNGKKRC